MQNVNADPPDNQTSFKRSIMPNRTKVFISYSRQDKRWLTEVKKYLKPLVRNGLELWHDNCIEPGDRWEEKIEQALYQTKVAILLITQDFFNSDYIEAKELSLLLRAAKNNEVTIIPLYLTDTFSTNEELSRIQGINDPKFSLDKLVESEQKTVLVSLSEQIRNLFSNSTQIGFGSWEEQRKPERNSEPVRVALIAVNSPTHHSLWNALSVGLSA